MTDRKRFKYACYWLLFWTAVLALGVLDAQAADYNRRIPGNLSRPVDSIVAYVYYNDGTIADSTEKYAQDSTLHDTTLTLDEDSIHLLEIMVIDTGAGKGWYSLTAQVVIPRVSGQAAAVDEAALAAAVDSAITANHGAGPYGPGSGDGTDTMTVYAHDSCDVVDVEGVLVTIRNTAGTAVFSKRTGVSGTVQPALITDSVYSITAYGGGATWGTGSVTGAPGGLDSVLGCDIPDPPAQAAVGSVTLFFDGGSGFVDSATGAMIPFTSIKYGLRFVPQGDFVLYEGYVLLPWDTLKAPTSAGRVQFTIVPTQLFSHMGYYELYYEARARRSLSRGTIRSFYLDTIPDPCPLDSTDQAWIN